MDYYPSAKLHNRALQFTSQPIIVRDPVVISNDHLGFNVTQTHFISYDTISMVYKLVGGATFMKPSVDTILMLKALKDLFSKGQPVFRAIDVGSGSGLIGKYIAKKAPGTGPIEVTLIDIDPRAKEFAESPEASMPTQGHNERPVKINYLVGDAIAHLQTHKDYDLIVSNPPYIPTIAETQSHEKLPITDPNFWEGTGLITHLIEELPRFNKDVHLVLVVTSLSLKGKRVEKAINELDNAYDFRILVEREVAWKASFAGGGKTAHLLASDKEKTTRTAIGGKSFFVGATPPGEPRMQTVNDGRSTRYHWQVVYILDFYRKASAH
jgi:methylase of polypeptide subunit release factors